jgi:hypothetical protein
MLGWCVNDCSIDFQFAFAKRIQASNCPQERSFPYSVRAKHANYLITDIE